MRAAVVTGYLVTLLVEPTALVRTLLGLAIVASGVPFYFLRRERRGGS